MEINVNLFDRICRVCLIQSTELKSLFTKLDGEERNLCEVLSFTANIDVKIEDRLPKQVCNNCESIMCKADAFKRLCLESETILNKVSQKTAATGEVPIIAPKCTIKIEGSDLKQKLREYGTLLSPIQKHSGDSDDFDHKNILLEERPTCSTNDCDSKLFNVSNSLNHYNQSVKQEVVNEETASADADNFDDGDHFDDNSVPQEEIKPKKIKSEGKKIGLRYECYCRTQFMSKEAYKNHLKQKKCNAITNFGMDISDLHCAKCNRQFNTISAWKVHQRNHRNDEPSIGGETETFQCSFCLRKFKNKISLASHIQRHAATDNIRHVCEICKREFKYKAYLENHILTAHSKTNEFACEVCAQKFTSKETLEMHKKDHENDKKHRCTVCNKGFYMLCTLKEHMRTHTGEKPFLCSQCGKGFSQKTNLAQHMRRHQGLKPFKCENCEKRFVSKGELDAHNRKHSGAHPFVCDECGNGFTTSSALVKHRRIHTGERPYQCDLCPMRFAASGTLKNHRRTHTGERPFQCSYCEKAFVQRNDLISHIRCHTGERPYVCTQCGQSFRKASGLKAHVKMHIKDPIVGINQILLNNMQREQMEQ